MGRASYIRPILIEVYGQVQTPWVVRVQKAIKASLHSALAITLTMTAAITTFVTVALTLTNSV